MKKKPLTLHFIAYAAILFASNVGAANAQNPHTSASACSKPLYLTFDTGHMGVADLVVQVLRRQQVKVTFICLVQ
jgi:peptidoglycan/xylan/chitin deacetylase (PgdA/CDA1 family)